MTPSENHLLNRNFLSFVVNRTFNVMAMHAFTVAIGWRVYEMTGDPLDLGLVGLSQFAPAFFLFLFSGIAADRYDRRVILVVSVLVQFVSVGLVMAVLHFDWGSVPIILAILVINGGARAFYLPASQAILPNMVPADVFPKAVAYSSSATKAAQLAGPVVSGLLIAWVGDGVYPVIMGLYGASAIAAWMIGGNLNVRVKEPVNLASVLSGFHFIWNNKMVLGAISIDLLAVLFGGVMGILPVYASDILHVGPAGLGVMRAMPAMGSLVTGLVLTQMAAPRHMGPALFISLGLFSGSVIVFGFSETLWISLVALAIYGAADMVSVYVRQTLVQLATPDTMRGRVSAVNSISINASNELGDFRAGIMAAGIGIVPAVVIGGAATLAITAIWCVAFPSIRRVDRLQDLQKPG